MGLQSTCQCLSESLTVELDLFTRVPRRFFPPEFHTQIARFKTWFSSFQGDLRDVALDMQIFEDNPAALQIPADSIPCLRGISDLRLIFSPDALLNPQWCGGIFRQLETLDLHIAEAFVPWCPVWDLSTHTLKKLSVTIYTSHPKRLCLAHVTGVTADLFQLRFETTKDFRPHFNFTTWAISQVSIKCSWRSCKGLPALCA